MCIWNEEDIIESSIRHLFAQGCSNVFIVDNASTDKTVENAIRAGAILAAQFESKYFDEFHKISYLNSVVKKYNEQIDTEYIWWLYVDADEFPNIDSNLTIFDFLKSLDVSIRAVQGYMFHHIPTHHPHYISSYHPVDFQPVCTKSKISKIPLLRYDKNKPHLYSDGGAHTFDTCGERISTLNDILHINHFNFRRPENTIKRIKQLTSRRPDGSSRLDMMDLSVKIAKKSKNMRSHYHSLLHRAKSIYNTSPHKILMTDGLSYNYDHIVRWYDPLLPYISIVESYNDNLLFHAIHYFFLEQYDLALCKFNDLLKITNDHKLKMLIGIRIALCLSFTDKKESLSLFRSILKCNDKDIYDYAMKQFNRINGDGVIIGNKSSSINWSVKNYYHKSYKKLFARI